MRALNRPFDAISRERFIYQIYTEVDPLDSWIDDTLTYGIGDQLWVDTVDASIISLAWYIDNVLIDVTSETLDLSTLGLAAGDYSISLLAYDNLLDHSLSGDSLDWWRLAPDLLQQTVSWSVSISAVPEPGSAVFLTGLSLIAFGRRRRT